MNDCHFISLYYIITVSGMRIIKEVKRGEAVVTLFETKTESQVKGTQLKKGDTALKFGMAVALKRYNVEL